MIGEKKLMWVCISCELINNINSLTGKKTHRVIITVLTITCVLHRFTLGWLHRNLILNVRTQKISQVGNVTITSTSGWSTSVRGTKLEVCQTLFVHAVESLIAVAVLIIAIEVITVEAIVCSAWVELDRIVRHPTSVLIGGVIVVVLERTSILEKGSTKTRIGWYSTIGIGCGGGEGGKEESEGLE